MKSIYFIVCAAIEPVYRELVYRFRIVFSVKEKTHCFHPEIVRRWLVPGSGQARAVGLLKVMIPETD